MGEGLNQDQVQEPVGVTGSVTTQITFISPSGTRISSGPSTSYISETFQSLGIYTQDIETVWVDFNGNGQVDDDESVERIRWDGGKSVGGRPTFQLMPGWKIELKVMAVGTGTLGQAAGGSSAWYSILTCPPFHSVPVYGGNGAEVTVTVEAPELSCGPIDPDGNDDIPEFNENGPGFGGAFGTGGGADGVGGSSGGGGGGSLTATSADLFDPANLHIAYNAGVGEERIPASPSMVVRQVRSAKGLTAVWTEGSTVTWACYPASVVGDLAPTTGEYTVTGAPSAVWRIVALGVTGGTASLEVIEERPDTEQPTGGPVVPGPLTLPALHGVTYLRYDQTGQIGGDQSWIITRGTIDSSGGRHMERLRSIWTTFDGRTKGISDTNAQGEVVSSWGITGDLNYPEAMVRGHGPEIITENFYYATEVLEEAGVQTSLKKLVLKTGSDGSWERYVYPDGLFSPNRTIIRPCGDTAMADDFGTLSATTSTMMGGQHRVSIVTETDTETGGLYREEAPDENETLRTVRLETKTKTRDSVAWLDMEETTIEQGGGRSALKRGRSNYIQAYGYGGELVYEQDIDGRRRQHDYLGQYDPSDNSLVSITETIDELEPDGTGNHAPRAGISHRTVRVTDAQGRLTSEKVFLCTSEGATPGYTPVTEVEYGYDTHGNLTSTTRKDATTLSEREIQSATWFDGRMISETDEFGQVTTYSDFRVNGDPQTIVRSGVAGANGLPAIPEQTITRVYDFPGRLASEMTSGDGLSESTVTEYDTAGRIKTQTSRGIAVSYSYPNGGRDLMKTFPGGVTETTTRYLDGRVKSVVRNDGQADVEKVEYEYSVTAEGYRTEKVTRGVGADAVWTKTTRNLAGFVIKEESAGDNDGVIATTYTYDANGRLASEQRTPALPKGYIYTMAAGPNGAMGFKTQTGQWYSTPSSSLGALLTSRHESEVVEGAEVFRVTATDQGVMKEKIGGFAGNEVSKTVVADLAGAEEVTIVEIDRATATQTTTVSRTGVTNQAVTIIRLGLVQSVLGFSGGNAAIIAYDGLRRPVSQTDARGETTATAYHPSFGQPESITRTGTSVQRTYYAAGRNTGRLSSQTINGQMTHYDYDGAGRLTKQWGPASYPVRYDYDTAGRLKKLHTYGQTAAEPRDGSFGIGAAWPEDGGEGHVTTWNYVPGSRLLREKVDAAGRKVTYAYNAWGLPATRTWARGVTATYGYWQTGHPASVNYSDGTPSVSSFYDGQGRLQRQVDAAGTHEFTYQPSGALWSETVTGAYASSLSLGYDAAGRLGSVQASMGEASVQQAFTYDSASGRMESVTGQLGDVPANAKAITATYGYRAGTDQIETTTVNRDHYGTLSELLTHTRTYAGPDRLVSVTATRGGTVVEGYTWGYDGAGRRQTATLSGGERHGDWWDYSYNERGEVTGGMRKDASGNMVPGYEFGYSFDALGNRIESWREAAGARSAYTANSLNQYESRTVPGEARVQAMVEPGTAKVKLSVEGQASTIVEPGSGGLMSVVAPIDNTAAAQYPEVTIDAVKPGGAGGTDWRQRQSGRLFVAKTPEVFTYDLDGNRTSDSRLTYEWDAENRLIATETHPAAVAAGVARERCEFAYDGRHRRIHKVVKTGWDGEDYTEQAERRFLYDEGWNLLAEVDGSGASIATYLWGLDLSGTRHGAGGVGGLLAERIGGKTYLPCYDGNGNIVRLVDKDGSEADTVYEYGPFGEALRVTGPVAEGNPFGWSTKYTDAETGLKYYGRRYLGDGRWLSKDPIEEGDGPNLYAFVGNSPTNDTDILGNAKRNPAAPEFAYSLGYDGVISLSGGNCGSWRWRTRWKLSPASQEGGFVIQTIKRTITVRRCGSQSRQVARRAYREAWRVEAGGRWDWTGGHDDWALYTKGSNRELTDGAGACTAGTDDMYGWAVYYADLNKLPSDFRPRGGDDGTDHPAGDLPATNRPGPSLPWNKLPNQASSNIVYRHVRVTWDCCAGIAPTKIEEVRP